MLIDKQNLPLVATNFMNATHLEDADLINSLFEAILSYEQNSDETSFLNINKIYEAWYEHTIKHFAAEEEEMLSKHFPPYFMHKSEHDRVLGEMAEIYSSWKSTKNISMLKNYIKNDLLTWLINHIQTMDTVTSSFFETGLSPCHQMRA